MRDQLEAAAVNGTSDSERRRVGSAAIGSVRGDHQSIDQNESVFLIAWTSSPVETASPPAGSSTGAVELDAKSASNGGTLENNLDENGDFGMADFTDLDQAFEPAKEDKSTPSKSSKGKARALETEVQVKMCELKVCSNAEGAPR